MKYIDEARVTNSAAGTDHQIPAVPNILGRISRKTIIRTTPLKIVIIVDILTFLQR